jgi:hypothetical protein
MLITQHVKDLQRREALLPSGILRGFTAYILSAAMTRLPFPTF